MKNNMLKFGWMVLFSLFYTLPLLAQGGGPGDDGGPGDGDPDPNPIDNWALVLVFAAVAVGVYFLVKSRRKAIA